MRRSSAVAAAAATKSILALFSFGFKIVISYIYINTGTWYTWHNII